MKFLKKALIYISTPNVERKYGKTIVTIHYGQITFTLPPIEYRKPTGLNRLKLVRYIGIYLYEAKIQLPIWYRSRISYLRTKLNRFANEL